MLKIAGLYRVLSIIKNNTLVKRLNIKKYDLIEVSMDLENNARFGYTPVRYVTVTNVTNNLQAYFSLNVLSNMICSGLTLSQEQ